jgi:uncharacterized protein (TIGR02996 family)
MSRRAIYRSDASALTFVALERNSHCPCGSGLAYRRCCRGDQRYRRELLRRLVDVELRHDREALLPVAELAGAFRASLIAAGVAPAGHHLAGVLREDLMALGYRCYAPRVARGLMIHDARYGGAGALVAGLRWPRPAPSQLGAQALAKLSAKRWQVPTASEHPLDAMSGCEESAMLDDPVNDALLAAVYAAPNDRQLRAVVADALLERGDPRGELIALQLAQAAHAEPTARERELLGRYERRWLGGLAAVAWPGSVRFDGGFVIALELKRDASAIAEAMTAAQWATLRVLRLPRGRLAEASLRGLLARPALAGVRRLGNMTLAFAETLAQAGVRLGVTSLALQDVYNPQPPRLNLEAFPRLRLLALPITLAENQLHALRGQNLETLAIDTPAYGLAALPRLWRRLGAERRALANVVHIGQLDAELMPTGPRVALRWQRDQGPVRLRISWHGRVRNPQVRALLAGLEQLPVEALRELVVPLPPQHTLPSGLRRRLHRVLSRSG